MSRSCHQICAILKWLLEMWTHQAQDMRQSAAQAVRLLKTLANENRLLIMCVLAEGEYGICMECGEEISPRRMEVRPFSRYCIECKTDIEKFGA